MANDFEIIREVRSILSCGLREAYDFYTAHGAASITMAKAKAASLNGHMYLSPEQKCRDAITEYYAALDRREHGGVAQNRAFAKIEEALGMHWVQGATLPKDN